MHFNNLTHLKKWEDAKSKIEKAKDAVDALISHASGYFQLKEEQEKQERRKKVFESMQKEKESFAKIISTLKDDFMN